MKNLKRLSINLKGKDEEAYLLQELPYLFFLNNEKVSGKNSDLNLQIDQKNLIKPAFDQEFQRTSSSIEKSSITHEDLKTLSILYDCIREVQKEVNPDKDHLLVEQFDQHVRNILFDLNTKLDDQNNGVLQSKSMTIKAKYALYEICFSKFMDFLDEGDHRLASILESLHDSHALIFQEMSSKNNIL